MRNLSLVCLLSFGLVITPAIATAQSGTLSGPPTEISADLGTCSALITLKDKDSKPIYNAKITARIRYGMMGAKKLDLETFTNSAGQAKIVKLPEVPKKPIYFYVSKDEMLEIVEFAPDAHCEATFDVVLK